MSPAPSGATGATALLAIAFLLLPAAMLVLVRHQAWAAKLGTIVLCYAAGLLVGNLGLLPAGAAPLQETLSEVSIALALPMILFTVDMRAWSRIAGRAVLSMALATAAIVVVAVVLFFVYRALGTPAAHELAGLAVGVYTGGTPNLAAIKAALAVDDTRYLLFNAFDTVIGAAYLMFMVALARPLLAGFLGRRPMAPEAAGGSSPTTSPPPSVGAAPQAVAEDFVALPGPAALRRIGLALLLSAAIVGASLAAGGLMAGPHANALVISLLATLGLVASLAPPVRRLSESYPAGMYLIYVFSFTVASMARFDAIGRGDLTLFAFVALAVFASLALHALLARLAKIDVDTWLVTSVGAICSPAFVPLLARQVNDRAVLASGMGTGIIGYAIGTQLGIAVALALKAWA